MKKLFFITAITIMSVSASQAQEVRIGAKAGVNFSNFGGDVEDSNSRTGFHLGGLVEVPINERFSIQPEILYSAQGSEFEESGSFEGIPYDYKVTTKLDYIQVPIMAKVYLIEGLAIEAGPQVAFLVSDKYEFDGNVGPFDDNDEGDLDENDLSSVDVSLGAGASYRLPMGLFFGARYNFGLSNVNDAADRDDYKIHNNVFQLSAGFSF
ncbi:porin family protein [Aequorivita sp. SDUM287046]|uniref:Porin family protein n=1 Tax=Aequorivita aurantiaca TaxID=3053356 RepID=A0ABT8DDT4_9FLAO|nr:porin family protein [Aequorivita aurantiaca]MDN3723421.1 porin family protein [Aequorivita aurantiaca]